MDKIDEVLNDQRYKSRIEALKTEDLQIVANDEIKALELAKKGIEEVEPEKKDDVEYLQIVANGMQELARLVLDKRSKN